MPNYDPSQIANLVGQLGGDHQQAAQRLQSMGGQINPQQHADMLQSMGVDPQKLQSGGYQHHLDAQNKPGFQGYSIDDMSGRNTQFGNQNYQQMGQDQGGMRGKKPKRRKQMTGQQQDFQQDYDQ